jgi:hypothetical protein
LSTNDEFPPPGGYKPITGTIFDLLDKNGISWADYFQDAPQGASFRLFGRTGVDPHFLPLFVFLAQAGGAQGVDPLPQVAFVDPNRDQHASTLEEMFDFEGSPSLNTAVGQASPPASDCTPH